MYCEPSEVVNAILLLDLVYEEQLYWLARLLVVIELPKGKKSVCYHLGWRSYVMKKRQGEVYINAASGYILVMHPALLYFQHLISIYKYAKGFKNGLDISLVIQ